MVKITTKNLSSLLRGTDQGNSLFSKTILETPRAYHKIQILTSNNLIIYYAIDRIDVFSRS